MTYSELKDKQPSDKYVSYFRNNNINLIPSTKAKKVAASNKIFELLYIVCWIRVIVKSPNQALRKFTGKIICSSRDVPLS